MGNDSSVLKECAIDETAIYKNGSEFSLHHAHRIEDKSQLSVFISKDHVGDRKNLLEMMGKVTYLFWAPLPARPPPEIHCNIFVDFLRVDNIFG